MRLKLKNTPEQVELIKAMGSKDPAVAREASEAFAAFLGPVVRQVIMNANTSAGIYTDAPYDEDDNPSYPLDLYYNEGANIIQTWSQNIAGGLPTSHVSGLEEMKIATYRLDSAVSMGKRYARKARLDVVSKAVERMANEILVKQDRNAWAVILKALAEASTGGNTHLMTSRTAAPGGGPAASFNLQDLNDMMIRLARVNESYAGGTPAEAYSKGLTDLYLGPVQVGDIRAFAYNAVGGSTAGATVTDLPDEVRTDIYRNAGLASIFGVTIHQLLELGQNEKYQTLLAEFTGATVYKEADGAAGGAVGAADATVIGIDNSKGAFVRPVARGEGGETFTAIPDDQFYAARQEKMGFYGFLEEGRVCLDSRAIVGINLEA
tara:strand:- start:1976 stop:3109 length:1134 start_codon:yes stop_codon:yes gene_type:complete